MIAKNCGRGSAAVADTLATTSVTNAPTTVEERGSLEWDILCLRAFGPGCRQVWGVVCVSARAPFGVLGRNLSGLSETVAFREKWCLPYTKRYSGERNGV